MKTLKIALVAMFVALTMVNMTYADGIKEKPKFKVVVNLNMDVAIQNSGLVRAMYQQVCMQDVLDAHQHVYIATVIYQGKTYRIKGTFDQWMRFFVMDGMPRANAKRSKNVS
jgi:hypothetical protein